MHRLIAQSSDYFPATATNFITCCGVAGCFSALILHPPCKLQQEAECCSRAANQGPHWRLDPCTYLGHGHVTVSAIVPARLSHARRSYRCSTSIRVEPAVSTLQEAASLREKYAVVDFKQQTAEIRAKVCKELLSGALGTKGRQQQDFKCRC